MVKNCYSLHIMYKNKPIYFVADNDDEAINIAKGYVAMRSYLCFVGEVEMTEKEFKHQSRLMRPRWDSFIKKPEKRKVAVL